MSNARIGFDLFGDSVTTARPTASWPNPILAHPTPVRYPELFGDESAARARRNPLEVGNAPTFDILEVLAKSPQDFFPLAIAHPAPRELCGSANPV